MARAITVDSVEYVTAEDVRKHLNRSAGYTADDDELAAVKAAGERMVQNRIGRVLWETVTERVTVSHEGVAILGTTPVISVTSVARHPGGAEIDPEDYTLKATSGLLEDLPVRGGGKIDVTYVSGRAVATDEIILATLVIIAWLWETQMAGTPSQFGDEGGGDRFVDDRDIPPRARVLLEGDLLGPVVA